MKCNKCSWSITSKPQHSKICKHKYGLDTPNSKQLTLSQSTINQLLTGQTKKKLQITAKNIKWEVKFFQEHIEQEQIQKLMVDIKFIKSTNQNTESVEICFVISLELEEPCETSFLTRHRLVECYKWSKHCDSWTVMLVKSNLLKQFFEHNPQAKLVLSVTPALEMMDESARVGIQGCDDSFFSKVYRNVGTSFDKRKYRSLLDCQALAREEEPQFEGEQEVGSGGETNQQLVTNESEAKKCESKKCESKISESKISESKKSEKRKAELSLTPLMNESTRSKLDLMEKDASFLWTSADLSDSELAKIDDDSPRSPASQSDNGLAELNEDGLKEDGLKEDELNEDGLNEDQINKMPNLHAHAQNQTDDHNIETAETFTQTTETNNQEANNDEYIHHLKNEAKIYITKCFEKNQVIETKTGENQVLNIENLALKNKIELLKSEKEYQENEFSEREEVYKSEIEHWKKEVLRIVKIYENS